MYGTAPHHGYVWGGSGGGIHTIACLENEPEVYDGGVPFIAGSEGIQQQWSAVGYWWLHCRHRRDEILDATSPGGSGDPFANLSHDEREALANVYRHGFPRGAEALLWFGIVWMATISQGMDYYDDFWTTPGYLGHDNPRSLDAVVLHEKAEVGRVIPLSEAPPDNFMAQMTLAAGVPDQMYAIELREPLTDASQLLGCEVRIVSGKAAGRRLVIDALDRDAMCASGPITPELFDDVQSGDVIELDNRRFVAWCQPPPVLRRQQPRQLHDRRPADRRRGHRRGVRRACGRCTSSSCTRSTRNRFAP